MNWDDAVAYALTLPGAELLTSYGQPAVKANGNSFLNVGHERGTSFCLHLPMGVIDMMMKVHPDTFWKTPHYEGFAAVLVRYNSQEEELVREMIARACERAFANPPPRPRKK